MYSTHWRVLQYLGQHFVFVGAAAAAVLWCSQAAQYACSRQHSLKTQITFTSGVFPPWSGPCEDNRTARVDCSVLSKPPCIHAELIVSSLTVCHGCRVGWFRSHHLFMRFSPSKNFDQVWREREHQHVRRFTDAIRCLIPDGPFIKLKHDVSTLPCLGVSGCHKFQTGKCWACTTHPLRELLPTHCRINLVAIFKLLALSDVPASTLS